MAIIYSYPEIGSVHNDDLFIISRTSSDNKTFSLKATELSNYILGGFSIGIAGNFGTGTIANGETLSITGANNEIITTASGQDITVSIDPKSVVTYSLSGQVSNVNDYKIVLNDSSTLTPTEVVLEAGSGIILLDQGGNTVQIQSPGVTGSGTVTKIPIWNGNQILGDSNITQDNNGLTFTIGGLNTTLGNSGNFVIPGQITTGTSTSGVSSFSNNVSVANNLAVGTITPAGAVALDVKQKATIRGGLVVSEFPGGVTVDNTSVVIGAGNNDIITGSDHCLAVGNNNQIINNSDNSVAFGQGNTLDEADASLVVGLSNTITGISGTTERSAVVGFSNSLKGYASAVYGGSNTVEINNNAFVLGFDHDVLALSSDSIFVFGEQNSFSDSGTNANVFMIGADITGSDGTMALGYRNDKTQYPSEDNNNGLGETKFVVSVGSASTTNSNALLITEGGVNKANTPQIPRVIMPTVINFDFADDTAAAANGIPVGGLYHTSGVVKIRVT